MLITIIWEMIENPKMYVSSMDFGSHLSIKSDHGWLFWKMVSWWHKWGRSRAKAFWQAILCICVHMQFKTRCLPTAPPQQWVLRWRLYAPKSCVKTAPANSSVRRLSQARHTNDNHTASRHAGILLASGTGDVESSSTSTGISTGPSHFPLISFAYIKEEKTGDQLWSEASSSSLMLRQVQDYNTSLALSPAPQTATKVLQQKGIEKQRDSRDIGHNGDLGMAETPGD